VQQMLALQRGAASPACDHLRVRPHDDMSPVSQRVPMVSAGERGPGGRSFNAADGGYIQCICLYRFKFTFCADPKRSAKGEHVCRPSLAAAGAAAKKSITRPISATQVSSLNMSSELSLVDPDSATAAPPASKTPWIGTEPLVRDGLHRSFRASAWFPQGGATSSARDERKEKYVPNEKVVFNRFKTSLRDDEQGGEQRSSSTGGRRPLSAVSSNASRSGSALMRRPPSAKKQSARPEWNVQAFTADVGRLHVSQRDKAMKSSRPAGDFGCA